MKKVDQIAKYLEDNGIAVAEVTYGNPAEDPNIELLNPHYQVQVGRGYLMLVEVTETGVKLIPVKDGQAIVSELNKVYGGNAR